MRWGLGSISRRQWGVCVVARGAARAVCSFWGFALRNCAGGLASQGCQSAFTLEEVTKPGEDRDPNRSRRGGEGEAFVLERLFRVSIEISNFCFGNRVKCALYSLLRLLT